MDIGSAFTYMFDDQEWITKIAIGAGITFAGLLLFPILIGIALFFLLNGYMLETLKRVRDGQPIPLPEWTDFGELFKTGAIIFVIALVYYLPSILVACIGAVPQAMAGQADSDIAQVLVFVTICLNCLQILLSLGAQFLFPAALIFYAQDEMLGSAFRFGDIFGFISENIGSYIIVFLLALVAGFLAMFGLILCGIGVLFTGFWSYLVTANLYGQLARKLQPSY